MSLGADDPDNLIERMRLKGVSLWTENGQLHFKARKGAISEDEFSMLKKNRRILVAHMELRSASTAQNVCSKQQLGSDNWTYPLTYSQLMHWRTYRLQEKPAIRQIASAIRLRGPLDRSALMDCIALLIERHEALRLRMTLAGEAPMQVLHPLKYRLPVEDLTRLSRDVRRSEVNRLIRKSIMEPLDIALEPLFSMNLLLVDKNEHILIWTMEHMISDASSMSLLLTELFTLYGSLLARNEPQLEHVGCQFPLFAKRQRQMEQRLISLRKDYWVALFGMPYSRFTCLRRVPSASVRGWGKTSFSIDAPLKAALSEFCRTKKITIVMGMLTAFAAASLRYSDSRSTIIQCMVDGRDTPEIAHTVGYFACPLFIPIAVSNTDTLKDLLEMLRQSYCRAYENIDYWYVHALPEPPPFTRSSVFNWVPSGQSFVRLASREHATGLSVSPIEFPHPMLETMDRDCDPGVLFYEGDREITGEVHYSLSRFSIEDMVEFASTLRSFVERLVKEDSATIST